MTLVRRKQQNPIVPDHITRRMNAYPKLQAEQGNTYTPSSIREADGKALFTKAAARDWVNQRQILFRPTPVSDRDPVAYAVMLDGLMRLEHDHIITSKELTPFLKMHYPHFDWKPVMVGRMLANIAEAAKVPNLGNDTAVVARRDSSLWIYRIRTTPRAWRWLGALRDRIGKIAEQTLAREAVEKNGAVLWDEFPWEAAKMS